MFDSTEYLKGSRRNVRSACFVFAPKILVRDARMSGGMRLYFLRLADYLASDTFEGRTVRATFCEGLWRDNVLKVRTLRLGFERWGSDLDLDLNWTDPVASQRVFRALFPNKGWESVDRDISGRKWLDVYKRERTIQSVMILSLRPILANHNRSMKHII